MFISYICSLSLILTHAIIFSVAFILFNILSVCNDISFLLFRSLVYVGISQISFDNPREPCVIWKAQFSSTPLTVNIIVSISIISHLSFYIASTPCIALRFPYSSSVCDASFQLIAPMCRCITQRFKFLQHISTIHHLTPWFYLFLINIIIIGRGAL